MNEKIEISRELGERIVGWYDGSYGGRIFKEMDELRALLANQSCGACNGCDDGCRLNRESPPAAPVVERQEPVAWLNVATGNVTTSPVVVMDWDDEKEQVQSLYTSPPAPVAVVLPERRTEMDGWPYSWNACLDKLKELNQ